MSNEDVRIDQVVRRLIEITQDNYNSHVNISDKEEQLNLIINEINILAEKLHTSTISEQALSQIYNSIPDIVLVIDGQLNIIDYNKVAEQAIQFMKSATTHLASILFEENNTQLYDSANNNILNRYAYLKTTSGVVKKVIYSRTKLDSKNRFLYIIKDISEVEKIKYQLSESEEKYQSIFDTSMDGIITIDESGKILNINPSAIDLLFDHSSYTNQNVCQLFKYKSDVTKLCHLLTNKFIVENYEIALIKRSGEELYCLISVTAIQGDNNKICGYRGLIKNITELKKLESSVLKEVVIAQELERNRIAKDLHDGLSQDLTAIHLFLSSLKSSFSDTAHKDYETYNSIKDLLHKSIRELRNISYNLMPIDLENHGLIAAVENLCKRINFFNEINAQIKSNKLELHLDKIIMISVYRIIQECTQNTLKHAGAKNIYIQINQFDNEINISLIDDGRGFEPEKLEKNTGMGLQNIYSRAKSINGVINLKSLPDEGTEYILTVPLNNSKLNY